MTGPTAAGAAPVRLTGKQLWPYLRELQSVCDGALAHLDRAERMAAEWTTMQATLDAQESVDVPGHAEAIKLQTAAFDAVESALPLWARASLLIFPVAGSGPLAAFRAQRGAQLQQLLGLTPQAPIENRDLRDAWMHFDERLDRLVQAGEYGELQRFTTSQEITARLKKGALRLFEMDRLVVHYRHRDGSLREVNLHDLKAAVADVQARAKTAWGQLPP